MNSGTGYDAPIAYREEALVQSDRSMQMNKAIHWRNLHGEYFKDARILVTGGAGFIGSHLAEALAALDASVVILDDLSGGSRENVQSFGPVDFVEGSILDPRLLVETMRGCRYVFHEAALGSVPRSVDQPRLYHEVNTTGTLNVLEAARQAGVSRVIFAGSSSVYGGNEVPWIETMPVRPCSPYAATKVAGEALLRAYGGSYDLDTVSLRYFNIFGPRQNAESTYAAVIAAFAKALLAGHAPSIYGEGHQSRDFTYVANAVHANLLAARHPGRLGGDVLNVGCGGRISVNDLARLMAHALARPDLLPVHQPERAGDLKHSFADLSHCRSVIGYQPIVDFESGLSETVGWYQSQMASVPQR